MNDRAELISNILNTLLASDDIDGAIIRLSDIINSVCSEGLPQPLAYQSASPQETQLP